MKNILLIGDLNNTLGNIYKSLVDSYRVQLSKIELDEVEGMVKIVEPDLAIISMYGVTGFDRRILEHLKNLDIRIPVIFIGTFEECKEYITTYNDSFFKFLERPVTQKDLLKKCEEMLNFAVGKNKLLKDYEEDEKKKKILVIDDSGVFLRTMKSLLEPGYETILAKSGEKGVAIAADEKPDLILLDYEMPGWDGKETLEQLRMNEVTEKIPVIFLTGVSDKNHIIEVLKMQPQGYILKPVDSNELDKKIQEVI